jgi:hypothetical protein
VTFDLDDRMARNMARFWSFAGLPITAYLAWSLLPAFAEASPEACSLVTNADVGTVIGRQFYDDPESTPLAEGSACTYGYGKAQVIIFFGSNAQSNWEEFVKNFGHEKEERYPISGVGESAYSFFPKPRDEYEDTTAFVVTQSGQYTVAVSVAAQSGQQAKSVESKATELAKLVLAKLP